MNNRPAIQCLVDFKNGGNLSARIKVALFHSYNVWLLHLHRLSQSSLAESPKCSDLFKCFHLKSEFFHIK